MIGIIVAEEKELIEVKKIIKNIKEKNIYEKTFYIGNIEEKQVVLVKSNVGKVNSARVTQLLIDNFDIKLVINVGTAGSVDNSMEIGDVVVATELVQHDFDVTPFGRKLGEIENIGESIKIDNKLLSLFDEMDVKKGIIASGDKFIINREEKDNIRNIFKAMCIEMEGASVAQVCFLDKIPFLVIRSITDKLDGSSKVDFEKFLESSSKNAATILKDVLKKY
ncbi:MAG: 5'-methylthioadenosine/adenosylhomocysteine nucleosidase [Bacilli bacterium]|nr:5'-methylthioadenosine/adenosylhomocysteine nucleosidase [Bacilli bacterium]